MKKKTKILIAAIIAVVVVGCIFLANNLISVQRYQNAVQNTTYEHVDASGIPDGTYNGEYDVDFIHAKVAVTVESGIIVQIELLEHRHERGSTAEGIEQRIVEEQRIDVDAISGATNSSTVIKKAVDNALSNAE